MTLLHLGLQEVSAAVVTCGDDCWVRLFEKASGELFAECPLPLDKPLISVRPPRNIRKHSARICLVHSHFPCSACRLLVRDFLLHEPAKLYTTTALARSCAATHRQ